MERKVKESISMLSEKSGKKLNTAVDDYVIFDLETTGVNVNTDAVIEISGIRVRAGEVVDEFSTLVNPGRPIPFNATQINGITDEMVADAPEFITAFGKFLDFAGDDVLVGHNIHRFDLKFLRRDAELYWGKTVGNDYIDTLDLAQICLPALDHHRLGDVAGHYGISTAGAHRALNDCIINQKVFECLKKEMKDPSGCAKYVKSCPICGNILKKRNGKYGAFLGCVGFPDCRYTEKL